MISISIKDLRQNLSKVGDAVNAGQSFTVFRRSRPIGRFIPLSNNSEVTEVNSGTEDGWTDFIDFTEGGKKEGMPGEEFLKILRSIDN